jgi:hypothetical protein
MDDETRENSPRGCLSGKAGGSSSAQSIFVGSEPPHEVTGTPGSLYLRDNDGEGEVWVHDGKGWKPLAHPNTDPYRGTSR